MIGSGTLPVPLLAQSQNLLCKPGQIPVGTALVMADHIQKPAACVYQSGINACGLASGLCLLLNQNRLCLADPAVLYKVKLGTGVRGIRRQPELVLKSLCKGGAGFLISMYYKYMGGLFFKG